MTKEEAIDFVALFRTGWQLKKWNAGELRKQLHDIRSHAQILQNKLSVMELKYEALLSVGPQDGVKGSGTRLH